jgi:hypothetical protein
MQDSSKDSEIALKGLVITDFGTVHSRVVADNNCSRGKDSGTRDKGNIFPFLSVDVYPTTVCIIDPRIKRKVINYENQVYSTLFVILYL